MNPVIKLFLLPSRSRFYAALKNPERYQSTVWRKEILPGLRNSNYWKARFRNQLPERVEDYEISDYDNYRDTIQSALNDFKSPLNGEDTVFWAKSTGSVGPSKSFPITQTYLKQMRRSNWASSYWFFDHYPGLARRKTLSLASLLDGVNPQTGIPIGLISNQILRLSHRRIISKRVQAVSREVYENPMTEENLQRFLTEAAASDVRTIIAPTPLRVIRLHEQLSSHRQVIIEALRTHPRFTHVKSILERDAFRLDELWPHCRYLITWLDSVSAVPVPIIRSLLQGVNFIDAQYQATEVFGCIKMGNKDSLGGVFHPGVHVYEFIEQGQPIRRENLLKLWELEIGRRYELFVTTGLGLVRYRMKDIFECTDKVGNSRRVRFLHKADQIVKFEGFALTLDEVLAALKKAGFPEGSLPFFLAPDQTLDKIVFNYCSDSKIPSDFVKAFERALMAISSSFQRVQTLAPSARVIANPMSEQWIVERLRDSIEHEQAKPKVLQQTPVDIRIGISGGLGLSGRGGGI